MASFELRQLQQAVALAEHRSFSRAAAALGQAQPTLSRAIQELERRVGGRLFHRDRRAVEPTELGWLFLEHARDIVARANDLERETRLAKGLRSGSVSVGLGPYAAEALLPVAAPRFVAAHPAVRMSIVMGPPDELLRGLRSRQLSFFLADVSVLEAADDVEVSLRLAPLLGYIVGRTGHPLATRGGPLVEDAFAFPFAAVSWLPPRVLQPILQAQEALRQAGKAIFAAFPAVNCPSVDLAARIAAHSDVLMFTPLCLVKEELEAGRLTPIVQPPWVKTEWGVVHLRRRTLSPVGAAFVKELEHRHAEVLAVEAELAARWTPAHTRQATRGQRSARRRRPDSATVECRSRR